MGVLVFGRAVQGLGAGAMASVAYVAVARGYAAAARPRMLALTSTAWVVPGLVGPGIAGLIAEQVGWRWVFLGLAPLAPLAAVLTLPALRPLAPGGDGRPQRRLPAALALAAGGLAVAAPALVRLLPAGTIRLRRGLPAAVAINGLASVAFFGTEAFLPLGLSEVRGQGVARAGLVLTTATLTWTAGSWLQERLAPRASRRALVAAGGGLLLAGVAGAAAVLATPAPVLLAPVAWGTAGLGMGLVFSTGSLTVLERAPAGEEGHVSAALSVANIVGVAVGTGVGGALVAAALHAGLLLRTGIGLADLLTVVVAAVTLAASVRIPARPPAATERSRAAPA